MTVYLVANTTKDEVCRVVGQVADILASYGLNLLIDSASVPFVKTEDVQRICSEREAFEACDIVITVGGDGTMLHAASEAMHYNKPILGVNVGRLGFLALVESDELDKLAALAQGNYIVERRSVLQVETEEPDEKNKQQYFALNDIVLLKQMPERTLSLNIFCDDILLSCFRGDGVIFATPVGSTAYSMSAGGPIVDARLDGMVVTQICAHIMHTPPLVVANDRVLRAENTGTPEEKINIICDGMSVCVLNPGKAVRITRSQYTVPFIQFNAAAQLESIDKKLKGR